MRSGIRVAVVIGLALAIIVCAIGVAVASPGHVLVNRDQSRSSELEPQVR
jgi:biopolymer transport protein ExbB/TolQ